MATKRKFDQARAQKEPAGKYNAPPLTHMRKVAFTDLRIEASKIMRNAERLRDDQGMLDAAEAKRQRKAAKLAAQSKKG